MPIYEFYCRDCHVVYHFFARRPDASRSPACPSCGRPDLERRASSFAISKGRSEPREDAPSDVDEDRLERAMASLAHEAGSLDDDDPKAAARFLRRVYDAAGVPLGAGIGEALTRLEAGEDPEAIEDDLGEALDEDPLSAPPEKEKKGASGLRRRLLPPRVDPQLYEM